MIDNRGVTLVELLVVLGIVGILAVALGFSYVGWQGGYKVEKEIKQLQAALTSARTLAMQTNRNYFFDISRDGRFYRITQDDSNGTAKVAEADGIFQQQDTWANIQASTPVSWGAVADTTDTTVTSLSRKIELANKPRTTADAPVSPNHAGLLIGFYAYPQFNWDFRLGFDKHGIARNMTWSIEPSTGNMSVTTTADIQKAVPISNSSWTWGNPTICIFTDYDGNGTSDYKPDFDCIIVSETRISIGKVIRQNTGGDWCREANCVVK